MKVVIARLTMYIDVEKIWYAVKPTEPSRSLFFVYTTMPAMMIEQVPGEDLCFKIREIIDPENNETLHLYEPPSDEFVKLLSEEEKQMRPPT